MDDARHLRPLGHAHGQHRAAASLGEERLLQRAGDGVRPCDPRELLADTRGDVAELAAQPAKERRCRIAKIGAVLLDRTVDGTRNRLPSDAGSGSSTAAQERRQRSSAHRRARRASSATLMARAQIARSSPRRKSASALSALDDATEVAMPASEGSAAACSSATASAVSDWRRATSTGSARRLERAGGRRSVLGLGSRRQALDDRRQLECRPAPARSRRPHGSSLESRFGMPLLPPL